MHWYFLFRFVNLKMLFFKEVTGDEVIREGHQLVLSCIAQGSSHMSFRWLKDGDPINVSKSAG